ncbi:MAG: CoA transferase [Betaproteobacteria bacterium]|jgi:crotonobetainyl-CoA:carnitine CoA-transferase CaiB-like acyl-CoA transferase|nr:CoA transferase [Betaproteobacteria bacterium]MDH4292877.1 CoA transferase [Betaproteobacteria bacterium]MDH5343408.1 CoA transferase [Betaproteobacteria bacterium]
MLPLQGVRVAEFCQVLAGPFAGCLLADMGADVIKVESPEGDLMRQWPPILEGYSQYFASVNRNKRSVVFDLKNESDRAAARQLALSADIVLENFRPGVMARFGLDYATLALDHPALVYCSVSAFGQTGPRATEGGFDMTVQAMSGVMSVTGDKDGRPAKCGIPIADFSAGLYAAFSVTAALHKARATGQGDHVDVSMLGSMLGIANLQTSELFATGRDPVRLGSAHPLNAPYAAFCCRDGYFALAAGTNKLWTGACAAIGRDDLTLDTRYTSPTLRAKNQDALREQLEAEFVKYDACDLLERMNANGVPCAPLYSYSQVLADPQVQHMQWVEDITLPNGVASKTVISPQRVSGQRLGVRQAPPALGAHTQQVIAELKTASTKAAT